MMKTEILSLYCRWWDQYKNIPWPDSCCLVISTCLLGHDERYLTPLFVFLLVLLYCVQGTVDEENHRQISGGGSHPDPALY